MRREVTMTAISNRTERKAPPKAFKPGVSGNPSGRPKKTPQELDLIAACKEKTPDALAVILKIMQTGDKDSVRLAAAQSIIERAYGKPVQPSDVAVSGGLVISRIERVIVDPAA